jgi:hypothetical protein
MHNPSRPLQFFLGGWAFFLAPATKNLHHFAMRFFLHAAATVAWAVVTWGSALSSLCRAEPSHTPRFMTHSHNDYSGRKPLVDALANRFDSVEADVWLVGERILVSHLGLIYRGDLKELYLDPLQKRVSEKGSVHGDGQTFYLWLDLKSDDLKMVDALHKLLSSYRMLATFTEEDTHAAPVTVVLTGNKKVKSEYVTRFALRKACRDSNIYDFQDPHADSRWSWYSLRWSDHFKWKGTGPVPENQKLLLKTLVRSIHEKKRRVRFWDAPDTPEFWRLAQETGVDAVGTDRVDQLGNFVRALSPSRAAE